MSTVHRSLSSPPRAAVQSRRLALHFGRPAGKTSLRVAYRPIERNLIRSARLYLSTMLRCVCDAGGAAYTSRVVQRPRPGARGLCSVGRCQAKEDAPRRSDAGHLRQILIRPGVVYRKLVCEKSRLVCASGRQQQQQPIQIKKS